MDERQESQKDKIKKQVDINKSHTLDGTNLGSQNGAVNHFGVQRNDKNSEEDKQHIRNKTWQREHSNNGFHSGLIATRRSLKELEQDSY